MRSVIRKILTWLLVGCIGAILAAVIGEFFIEVARDKGWYDQAGRRWDTLVSGAVAWATSGVVLYPLAALAGIVAGMWIDAFLARREKTPAPPTPEREREAAAEPAPEGLTLVATATVRDPTPEEDLARSLYVGMMDVNDHRLESEHVLEIGIRGFNGFRSGIRIASVEGHIAASLPVSEATQEMLILPQPTPLTDSLFPKISEFGFALEQVLRPAQAAAMMAALQSGRVTFDLSDLEIVMWAPDQSEHTATRLKLWDGLGVERRERLWTARIVSGVGTASVTGRGSIDRNQ